MLSPITNAIVNAGIFGWDAGLALYNLVAPKRPVGSVVPEGHPGAGGVWPDFIPPKEGDSRSACPALNAMANHGILPRDGRNISFKELSQTIRTTYNFSPSFCYYVPLYSAQMLHKDYDKDTFDLADLDLHNGIEHDASLTRQDTFHQADQGAPYVPYINELLESATGKLPDGSPLLTPADLSRYSSKRRADAKATNPDFSLSLFHKVFGSSNSSTLLTIFGGRIKDLETVLLEERLPEGWESRIRDPMGLTFAAFNMTVLRVEYGIDNNAKPDPKAVAAYEAAQAASSNQATASSTGVDRS